jgi:hypothetical protein
MPVQPMLACQFQNDSSSVPLNAVGGTPGVVSNENVCPFEMTIVYEILEPFVPGGR